MRVSLGKFLKSLREQQQLSQIALAKKLGCTSSFVSQVERGHPGKYPPDLGKWMAAVGREDDLIKAEELLAEAREETRIQHAGLTPDQIAAVRIFAQKLREGKLDDDTIDQIKSQVPADLVDPTAFAMPVIVWNLAAAKYAEKLAECGSDDEIRRANEFYRGCVHIAAELIAKHEPIAVCLNEVFSVRGDSNLAYVDFMAELEAMVPGTWEFFPALTNTKDTIRKSFARMAGNPHVTCEFEQGYAIFIPKSNSCVSLRRIWADVIPRSPYFLEQQLTTGIYLASRNSEKRLAILVRLRVTIMGKAVEVIIATMHLPTLVHERENLPKYDREGSEKRCEIIDEFMDQTVTEVNLKIRERWKKAAKVAGISIRQSTPLWFLVGDMNDTPKSEAIARFRRAHFIDLLDRHFRQGTKIVSPGSPPQMVLDYVFAGPRYTFGDDYICASRTSAVLNAYDLANFPSDHLPVLGIVEIPLEVLDDDEIRRKVDEEANKLESQG